MDVRTKFVNKVYFRPRMKALEKYATNAEEIQMDVLKQLVSKAVDTEWGKKYGFANMRGYEDFAANQDLNTYEELKSYIHRMREGASDVLIRLLSCFLMTFLLGIAITSPAVHAFDCHSRNKLWRVAILENLL